MERRTSRRSIIGNKQQTPALPHSQDPQEEPPDQEKATDIVILEIRRNRQTTDGSNVHEMISNFVNSADRIASLVKEEDRSCAYQVYLQDRNKVVQFLDAIAHPEPKPCHDEQLKNGKEGVREDYLNRQLEAIRVDIGRAIRRKKRSKSSCPPLILTGSERGDEVSTIRYLLAQQSSKNNALKVEKGELEKQIQRLQSNFVFVELLTFKSEQMLLQNLIDNDSTQFSLIEKEKAAAVLSSLQQTILHIRSQTGVTATTVAMRLKQEAQSLVLYISEMRRKALALLKEKERSLGRLQREQQNFQQLRVKVDRLNGELGELAEEVDRKDELIEYVKLQNRNLKEDLCQMEEMVRQVKQQYQSVADELYLSGEKVKVMQSLLQGHQEQVGELLAEIEGKNRELMVKLEEIQAREQDIGALRREQAHREQVNARAITTLSEEKKLLALEKQRRENELRESESKVRFLEEEGSILERKIETVFNEQEDYKFRISLLEDKVEALERENQQLYADLRGVEDDEADGLLRANKQLEVECVALRKEAEENGKRIRFYQEQMVQLAKMTDTSSFEKAIEEQQKTITYLQLKLNKQENPQISPIPEENSEQLEGQNSPIQSMDGLLSAKGRSEDNPEWADSKGEEVLQDLIDCLPSFEQRGETLSDRSGIVPGQLNVSREDHSGVSALSYYEIHVTNENLHRIDSHKAVSPKKVLPNLLPASCAVVAKASSNFADFQPSEMHENQQPANGPNNEKGSFNSDPEDSDDEKLSQVSRNVNVDREMENEERMQDIEENVTGQQTPVKQAQGQNILMTEAGLADSRRQGHSPMKNVDTEQEMRAELRFEGEIEREGRKVGEDRPQRAKGNLLMNNNFGKILRARSCVAKDD